MTAKLIYVLILRSSVSHIIGLFKTKDEAVEYSLCFDLPSDTDCHFEIDVVPYYLNDASKT